MDSRKRVLRHILKSYHGKDVLQRCSEPDFVYEDAEAEDHVRQHDHDVEYDDFDSNGLDELEKVLWNNSVKMQAPSSFAKVRSELIPERQLPIGNG